MFFGRIANLRQLFKTGTVFMLQHHQLREVADHPVEALHGKVYSSRLGIILVAKWHVWTEGLDHLLIVAVKLLIRI